MSDTLRAIAICGLVGACAAGLLALPAFLPSAMANEQPLKTLLSAKDELFPKLFDPRTLAKYDVVLDPSVSTDVLSTQTVKKIGFGQVTIVTIIKTPTGTYSSDAVTSPYVQYPGIEVSRKSWARQFEDLGITGWAPAYSGSFVVLLAAGNV
ncbi:MAG: hypothetical protein ABIO40_05590 [Devosia sp.]